MADYAKQRVQLVAIIGLFIVIAALIFAFLARVHKNEIRAIDAIKRDSISTESYKVANGFLDVYRWTDPSSGRACIWMASSASRGDGHCWETRK